MPKLLSPSKDGERYELRCPTAMPHAGAFLWNRTMLLQANCRGFATAQHMQPEPGKYSHAPNFEQRTFMQPEQPLYAHHPGRFVYVSDDDSGELFSVPHEPVRRPLDEFVFSAGKGDIEWCTRHGHIKTTLSVALPVEQAAELWTVTIENNGGERRRLQLYPYFTIGYMSWMNQSAAYREDVGGIVASSVTPYQKVEDYPHIKELKDRTVLLHGSAPDAWEANRDAFEGEGGLHNPDAIASGKLANGNAIYETPVAVLQYSVELDPGDSREFRFVFAPARDDAEIRALREEFLVEDGFERTREAYEDFLTRGRGCIRIDTPDNTLDNFVNHWLDRQVYYHGGANRLTTDPQTRNYLQDSMGMAYVDPAIARASISRALAQQEYTGALPEGIVLRNGGTLKYINQVPHTDHCVWIPLALQAYLNETVDYPFLDQLIVAGTDKESRTVFERVTSALRWLIANRDERGLSLIAQGDWCDPMNMVGNEGKGVSGWLTIATVHALNVWKSVCASFDQDEIAAEMQAAADQFSEAAQKYLWDGDWFARGITDEGNLFGVSSDAEGRIFLNPQSWALLSGVATPSQKEKILKAIEEHLSTPFGPMLLAPAYTKMREDIGRITQKHPGSGENGSVYNHATTFCIHALYASGDNDHAYRELLRMIPGPSEDDFLRRGQLPTFVPNYYRGAVHQFPRTAGRSSQLFNTGAASWLYQAVVESLFGLKGTADGLHVDPKLPSSWETASAERRFRGATFNIRYRRTPKVSKNVVRVDGNKAEDCVIREVEPGRTYSIEVDLPEAAK